MKPAAFTLGADDLEKIDKLRSQRGTNRSEALRHIIGEFFKSDRMDLISELEKIKAQNRELKYQLQDTLQKTTDQNNQLMKVLLLLGGRDEVFQKEVMERFPQFWQKQ